MPSLRASRFAVSAALSDCTITYVPVIESLTEAPLENACPAWRGPARTDRQGDVGQDVTR